MELTIDVKQALLVVLFVSSLSLGGLYLQSQSTVSDLQASLDNTTSTVEEQAAELERKETTLQDMRENISELQQRAELLREDRRRLENDYEELQNQAMILSVFDQWYEDSNGVFNFDFNIYNMGLSEARDLVAYCGIFRAGQTEPFETFEYDLGNLASKSFDSISLQYDPESTLADDDTALCAVVDCQDCLLTNERFETDTYQALKDSYESSTSTSVTDGA